jgi:hypothetical protein
MDRRRKLCLSMVVLGVWSSDSYVDDDVDVLSFLLLAIVLRPKNYGGISDLI